MKAKDMTVRFAAIQFCFWTCFAGVVAFSSFYLLGRGMTNTEIGMIIAVSGTAAALLQPVTGALMDRFRAVTSPGLLAFLFVFLIADALALVLFPDIGTLVSGILYGLMIMTVQLTQSLMNVFGVDLMARGNRLNFNIARAVGSAGYAAAAAGIGVLTVKFPSAVIPVLVAAFAAAVVILSGTCRVGKSAAEGPDAAQPAASGPVEFLKRYPLFMLLLPAMTMIYFGHAVLNTFTLQIMNALGAGSAEMGTATAIAAVCEMVTVAGFSVLRKRFSIRTLLRISGVFFALKSGLSLLAASAGGFYAAQACQMFGWGIMCVAIVYYVNDTVPEADRAKGQTYAGMTLTAANVLSAVIGGRVIDTGGIRVLMLIGLAVCVCGMLLMFPATRNGKRALAAEMTEKEGAGNG